MINQHESSSNHGLSRREVLRRLGLVGAAALATPAVLTGCGDDDDDATAGTSAGTAGGGSAAPAEGGSSPAAGDVGPALLEALGLESGDNLGGGTLVDRWAPCWR